MGANKRGEEQLAEQSSFCEILAQRRRIPEEGRGVQREGKSGSKIWPKNTPCMQEKRYRRERIFKKQLGKKVATVY